MSQTRSTTTRAPSAGRVPGRRRDCAAHPGHQHHLDPGPPRRVRATVSPSRYARIEVQDNDGPWAQAMTSPARYHGLDIIRAVADAWGSDADQATRTVWARFDWPG